MRTTLLTLGLGLVLSISAQPKAATCFFSATFEVATLPTEWSNSTVEVLSTGETTEAWTIGNASQANANGFFPVVDQPIGNRFAMVNDDAAPCDCGMDQVYLTSPVIDLTGRTSVSLECRVFHEMALGGGPAKIEASTNGTDWTLVDSLPALNGDWQNVFVDLSGFDGASSFQLRFNWSDGGTWASGFAVDDICLRERNTADMTVTDARFGNDSISPFIAQGQQLGYSKLPLEHTDRILLSVDVMNRGTSTVNNVVASAEFVLNGGSLGIFNSAALATLAPGARATLIVRSDAAPGNTGALESSVTVNFDGTDEDLADNSGSAMMQLTGAGWSDGYGAMARDAGAVQGRSGSAAGFIAANRVELVAPDTRARGISFVLGVDSRVGEVVRGILLDSNLAFLDTTARHTITQEDIDLAYGSGAIYLPLTEQEPLPAGDHFVGMQRIAGEGYVAIATSGVGPIGGSIFLEGLTFDPTWPRAIPMVRLHFSDYGVGVQEGTNTSGTVRVHPNPASDFLTIHLGNPTDVVSLIEVWDMEGRRLLTERPTVQPASGGRLRIEVAHLPSASYVLRAVTGRQVYTAGFRVIR